TLNTGGTLEIASGYTLSGFATSNPAFIVVLSAGSAVSTTVNSGSQLTVFSGGAVTSGGIFGGHGLNPFEFLAGVPAKHTPVGIGGFEVTLSGATADATTVSGGLQYIGSGGSATNASLRNFGQQTVDVGGVASGPLVNFQGVLIDAGLVSAARLATSATMYVL